MVKIGEKSGVEMASKSPKELLNKQNKEKREKKMNNLKTKAKTPLTVAATLAVVAVLFGFYTWSFNQGVQSQKSINQEVAVQVAQLKTKQK